MKEKGLCMSALRNAERAFFDSVLGFEGFDAKILSYLFSAVVPVPQQSAETVVDGDKLEGLMSAISAAVDRKKQLATLSNIVERLNSFASSNKGARDVKCDVVAKAEALLKKHLRLSEKTMQEHLKTIDAKDDASFELVCHEALLACDGDAKGCERVKGILLSFIRTVVEKNSNVIMRTDDTLMGELCDRDVCVFDAYLSMLLSAHVKMNAAKAGGRTKIKDVDLEEVRMRIRSLMGRKGYVCILCRALLTVTKLTDIKYLVMFVCRPVGHSSRSVVEAYCAKTGTQEFRCKQ